MLKNIQDEELLLSCREQVLIEKSATAKVLAARLSLRIEEVQPLLEQGEISLTSLTLLSPVLNQENAKEILPKVLGKSSREVEVVIKTRRVAVPTAREVKKKAGFRCEFVSLKGIRCSQTAHLEIDHIRPWALGGSSKDIQNLRYLCKVHNLFFAEQYFPAIGKLGESQKSR